MHSVDESVETGTREALEASIGSATRALLKFRQPDGHWVFELEADSTIPAEYVLLGRYLGEPVDASLEARSPVICAGCRAPMVAGPWCTMAIST